MKILITAGPTREPIDPVRFISNRSSGKMGFAIAEAAGNAGHDVELIVGPVAIQAPHSVHVHTTAVETTREMYDAVAERINLMDVAIMTAAVADYRPVQVAAQKIKKTQNQAPEIRLEKTEDILGSARDQLGYTGILVGFAAETEHLDRYAVDKLKRKRCDLIVANDVSRQDIGFDSDANEISLFFADGRVERLPKAAKSELARRLIEEIERLEGTP